MIYDGDQKRVRAARDAAGSKDYPSDLTIVGIIDYWDEQTGRAVQTQESGALANAD